MDISKPLLIAYSGSLDAKQSNSNKGILMFLRAFFGHINTML